MYIYNFCKYDKKNLPSFVLGAVGEVNEKLLWLPLGIDGPPTEDVEFEFKCELILLPAWAARVCAAWVNDAIVVGGNVNAVFIGVGNTFEPNAAAWAAA